MAEKHSKLEVVWVPISEVEPYENNPRLNEASVDNVANSIKDFGWKQPIVVDKDKVIVAGHTRWKAAQKLGLKEIPIVIADDLSEEEVRAYRLADNKVGESSLWDFERMDVELDLIKDIDMSAFGFRTQEFEWADVEPISEDNYTGTNQVKICCPECGYCGLKQEFKKACDEDE